MNVHAYTYMSAKLHSEQSCLTLWKLKIQVLNLVPNFRWTDLLTHQINTKYSGHKHTLCANIAWPLKCICTFRLVL